MEDNVRKKVKIAVNESRSFSAFPGVSLLQALKDENIFLPSACGGRGICGLCRLKVLEGAPTQLTPAETIHLNHEEIQATFRLACQVKLERDVRISIPDSFLHAREYRADIAEIHDLTHDIKELRLKLLTPPSISFKSGQYIQLRIPSYGVVKKIAYRAYSIASPPSSNQMIELEIRRVPNGFGTTYIFDHLKPGNVVSFNGPHGDFFLRDGGKDIVMIAGGAGMAPMKSMLADMHDHAIKRKTRYFFGARSPADIFYADLMRSFEQTLSDFRFIPSVATIPPDEKWEGETGLIPEVVERRLAEAFDGEVYLCGSPAMIEACLLVLAKKNIPKERIFYDKFA